MEPGTHLTLHHLDQFQNFVERFAGQYGAAVFKERKGNTRILTLKFPDNWKGLEVTLKWPTNVLWLDLDLTVRSAVSEHSIFCTKDEGLARVFLSTLFQLYAPLSERF